MTTFLWCFVVLDLSLAMFNVWSVLVIRFEMEDLKRRTGKDNYNG